MTQIGLPIKTSQKASPTPKAVTTTGVRTEENSSRIPDVVVCTPQLWEQGFDPDAIE